MQRKNHILRARPSCKRGGFALIMAISVLVVIAGLMAVSLSLTAQTSKRTTDIYLYEQAVLLSKSAAEYAILEITKNPPCSVLNRNFSPPAPLDFYDINIDIRYIYSTPCTDSNANYTTVTTPESNGSVLMDITVSVNDTNITSEPIRYFRRTIQKL